VTPSSLKQQGRHCSPGWHALVHDEHGSAVVELVLLTPVLILMLLFIVLCARLSDADLRLGDAAHQAARAATTARNPIAAASDATSTAQTALADAGIACQSLSARTDTGGLQPGSTVTTTLSCTIGLRDLALLSLPGSVTLTATSSSIVDIYRGVTTAGGQTP
jgi:Flp pilus assembly protein TadG